MIIICNESEREDISLSLSVMPCCGRKTDSFTWALRKAGAQLSSLGRAAFVGVVNSVGGAPFFVALNGASTTYCSGQTRVQVSNGVSSVFVVVVVWCCGCEVLVLWYSGMV